MAVLRPDLVLQFRKYVTCNRIATPSGTMSLIGEGVDLLGAILFQGVLGAFQGKGGSEFGRGLLLPGLERIGEGTLAGRAFFHGKDGAAVVVRPRGCRTSRAPSIAEDCAPCLRPCSTGRSYRSR